MGHYSVASNLLDAHKNVKAQKDLYLYTINGLLGSAINAVQHFVLMKASHLVDPTTFQRDPNNNTQSLWQLYHNEAFSALLNHSAFHSSGFKSLESSILSRMEQQSQLVSMLSEKISQHC
jgi:hypothetical protein